MNNKIQPSTQHQSFRANGINNQLETFKFEDEKIQAITDEKGELWFIAKEVCNVLGLKNPTMALENLDDDERAKLNLGRQGESNIINESGLYSLITTSRKQKAKKFKKWVTSEVLPSIRKTGSYSVKPIDPMALFADPAAMLQLATNYAKRIIEQDEMIAEQAPKVAALERLSESEGSLCLTDAAKTLKIPRHKLITHLSTERYIYKRGGKGKWITYQNRIESRLLEHRTVTIQHRDGTEITTSQVLITPKGLAKLAQIFEQ